MFSPDKPLPPPPAPPKPRNASLAASMPSYRSRPSTSSSGVSSSQAFDAARTLFQAAKQPEVRHAAVAAAKNPVVRSTAVSVAKNEQARSIAIKAAQDEKKRESFFDMAKAYDSQLARSKGLQAPAPKPNSSKPPLEPRQPTAPPASVSSIYPSLLDDSSWDSPPKVASAPSLPSMTTSWTAPAPQQPAVPSWGPSSSPYGTMSSGGSNFSAIHNELASLNLFSSTTSPKKVPPARPPPPKGVSRSSASPSPTNEPHAIVKYPYKSTHFDELNCLPNDVVLLKKEVDEQWIYALNTRTGECGIVPIVFLTIKVPLAPTQRSTVIAWPPASSSTSSQSQDKCAVALYDFSSGVAGDLNFSANETIRVVEKVNDEWLRGQIGSRTGIFPASYVQMDAGSPLRSPPPVKTPAAVVSATPPQTVLAIYDFNSGVAGDLVFQQGDVIEVVERVNAEWIRGRLRGCVGLVPCTYVDQSFASSMPTARRGSLPSATKLLSVPPRTVAATRDYFNPSGDHLCFSRGDHIEIVEEVDENWLRGKLVLNMSNTKSFPCGLFPRSAIQ